MVRLRVRELAEAQGLNAPQLARRADLSTPTVYALWKDPYRDVPLSTLAKIATVLGCRVTDLIENGDDRTGKTEAVGCAIAWTAWHNPPSTIATKIMRYSASSYCITMKGKKRCAIQ